VPGAAAYGRCCSAMPPEARRESGVRLARIDCHPAHLGRQSVRCFSAALPMRNLPACAKGLKFFCQQMILSRQRVPEMLCAARSVMPQQCARLKRVCRAMVQARRIDGREACEVLPRPAQQRRNAVSLAQPRGEVIRVPCCCCHVLPAVAQRCCINTRTVRGVR